MTVPFAFANLSGTIALSKLDSNFNTPITIGNTSVQLGNTITTVNNLTLTNVTITSAFITTGNIATANVGNLSLLNPLTVPNGGTGRVTLPVSDVLLGNGTGSITSVAPGNAGNVLTSVGGVWVSNASVSLSVGGSNGQVQYNNANAFGGISGFTTDGTRVTASTTIGVGGATPSISGSGVTFPATQSASSDVNTLDDYEEGTWTPTIAFGGNSVGVTYNASTAARYTKIGRFVLLNGYILLTNKGSSSGIATIGNLPFAISSTGENGNTSSALGYAGNITYTGTLGLWFGSTANPRFVDTSSGVGITNLTETAFANTSECIFSFVYTTV